MNKTTVDWNKVPEVYRDILKRRLSVSSSATVYGCCGLLDLCNDQDLMSLSLMGTSPLLDWIGWEPSDMCTMRKYFITWARAAENGGAATPGYLADPCADAYGAEWGGCDFLLDGFGRLRRATPVRDATRVGLRFCEAQPRYRLDGTPITDDLEYDMRIATEALIQDLNRLIITGAHTNGTDDGLFNGLQSLVTYGYQDTQGRRCTMMDSIVIDWNRNTICDALTGEHGATWNGTSLPAGVTLIDVLRRALQRVLQRIRWAGALNINQQKTGDIVLVMPSTAISDFLDCFTCWSVCAESTTATYEARTYRDSLNGGAFGAGQITLDGVTIPILPHDYALINSATSIDMYLLVRAVGGQRLITGQYNPLNQAVAAIPNSAYTDGGRLLTWTEQDNTCVRRVVEMQPRLLVWAPWAQVRIQDVYSAPVGGHVSADAWTSFYPETSFNAVTCS